MDLEGSRLSDVSQTEEDKYNMISLTCGIYRTQEMNKHNRNRLTDAESRLMVHRWEWVWGSG